METRDRIGRRRQPGQNRGLRPLFPKLPSTFESRAVRIAMTAPAWHRIDTMVAERPHETRPRALGEVVETLLAHFEAAQRSQAASDSRPAESEQFTGADWQAWQIHKERALLPALHVN